MTKIINIRSKLGTRLYSTKEGQDFGQLLLNHYVIKEELNIVIDFEGVLAISPSFAKAVFENFVKEYGKNALLQYIQFINISYVKRQIIEIEIDDIIKTNRSKK